MFDAGENDGNENLDAKIYNHVKVPIVRILGGYACCNLPSQELCKQLVMSKIVQPVMSKIVQLMWEVARFGLHYI